VTDLHIPEERVSVVLNGTNIDIFNSSYDKNSTREHYDLGSGPLVTFVGVIQPWHGIDLLISSFVSVQSKFPDSQLILVGECENLDSILLKISELGLNCRVKLLGRLPQEQVAAVLEASDIAVAPYPYDHDDIVGTPLKIIEYMAAGKAIVASQASIHEVITHGVTGLRVKPADENALAHGIIRLIEDQDLRAKLGANAASQAQHYSWENVVEQLENAFEQVLAN